MRQIKAQVSRNENLKRTDEKRSSEQSYTIKVRENLKEKFIHKKFVWWLSIPKKFVSSLSGQEGIRGEGRTSWHT